MGGEGRGAATNPRGGRDRRGEKMQGLCLQTGLCEAALEGVSGQGAVRAAGSES